MSDDQCPNDGKKTWIEILADRSHPIWSIVRTALGLFTVCFVFWLNSNREVDDHIIEILGQIVAVYVIGEGGIRLTQQRSAKKQ